MLTSHLVLSGLVGFGTVPIEKDNWEPRLSKLDSCLSLWKSRSLTFLGKVVILNVLGLSNLLYLSRVLIPPRCVLDKYNSLIWPFLWGAKLEPVAWRSIVCSLDQGGLSLIDFWSKGEALRLSSFVKSFSDPSFKCFHLVRYFCESRLLALRPEWSTLRDIRVPKAASPSKFYSRMIDLKSCNFPGSFAFDSKSIYKVIIKRHFSLPVLPTFWSPLLSRSFSVCAIGRWLEIHSLKTIKVIFHGLLT